MLKCCHYDNVTPQIKTMFIKQGGKPSSTLKDFELLYWCSLIILGGKHYTSHIWDAMGQFWQKNIDQSEQSLLLLVEKSILTVTTLILICCQQSSIYCWFRGPRAASHTLGLPEIMDIYIVTYPLKNIMAWFTSTRGV